MNRYSYGRIGAAALFALLQACTTVETANTLTSPVAVAESEGIVLLANATESVENISLVTDDDMEACIVPAMRSANAHLRLIPARTFRARLYPYFSPSTMPGSLDEFQRMINDAVVHARIDTLRIRFLVLVERAGSANDVKNGIFCGAAMETGACLGLMLWDRRSEFVASVWDLRTQRSLGNVSVNAQGRGYMPALLIPLPVYVPATHNRACQEFGQMLGRTLGVHR